MNLQIQYVPTYYIYVYKKNSKWPLKRSSFCNAQRLITRSSNKPKIKNTRCRPSKGRRCIPDVDIAIGACWDLLECWFKLFSSTSQNTSQIQFRTFLKKNQISWFSCCSTREDLSIDVSITNVGLILTKLRWFLFSGCGQTDGQTDRHGFGILPWKHVGTQKISTQSSKLVVSRRSLYASPEVGDA